MPATAVAAAVPPSANDWYERLASWLLNNPGGKLQAAATALNASPSWLSILARSDSFRAYFKSRVDAEKPLPVAASRTTLQRVAALADVSIDALTERVERNGAAMPIDALKDTASLALRHLAAIETAAAKNPATAAGPVHVSVIVGSDVLERARRLADEDSSPPRPQLPVIDGGAPSSLPLSPAQLAAGAGLVRQALTELDT